MPNDTDKLIAELRERIGQFETSKGHRILGREDFRPARAALSKPEGDGK